jgi:hypothetical protein
MASSNSFVGQALIPGYRRLGGSPIRGRRLECRAQFGAGTRIACPWFVPCGASERMFPDPVQDPQPCVDFAMAVVLERRARKIGVDRR